MQHSGPDTAESQLSRFIRHQFKAAFPDAAQPQASANGLRPATQGVGTGTSDGTVSTGGATITGTATGRRMATCSSRSSALRASLKRLARAIHDCAMDAPGKAATSSTARSIFPASTSASARISSSFGARDGPFSLRSTNSSDNSRFTVAHVLSSRLPVKSTGASPRNSVFRASIVTGA